jgi:hypothetical protein
MSGFVLGGLFGFVMGFIYFAAIDAKINEDEVHHDYNGRNGKGYQPKYDLPHKSKHNLGPPRNP